MYQILNDYWKLTIPLLEDIGNLFHILYRSSKQALFGNSFVSAHTAIAQSMQFF